MILGVDADALVNWLMGGAPNHVQTRRFFERQILERGNTLGITTQVLYEFLHVCTDERRFEKPLAMEDATRLVRRLWNGKEVVRIQQSPAVLPRTLELLENLNLGRKRILDTALAATLEAAGVKEVVTLNTRDFQVFPVLEATSPL